MLVDGNAGGDYTAAIRDRYNVSSGALLDAKCLMII
jgi:hypothetical protein